MCGTVKKEMGFLKSDEVKGISLERKIKMKTKSYKRNTDIQKIQHFE